MTTTLIDLRNGISEGLAFKAPCRAATTQNVALAGTQTIDGVSVGAGDEVDRVLVGHQSDPSENGIYDASSGIWTRSLDFDSPRDFLDGTLVNVTEGSVNGETVFMVGITDDPVVVGTSHITITNYFSQVQSAAAVAAAASAAASAAIAAASATLEFDSYANAAAATIPSGETFIRLAGYTSKGDFGGALYKKVNAQPSHPGKIQSADGAWWEIVEPVLMPEMFGATAAASDAYTGMADCITTCIALGALSIRLRSRVYLLSATVDFGNIRVTGAGTAWQNPSAGMATILRGTANNMLVCKNGTLETLVIDGDGKALWGWLDVGVPRKACDLIEVIRCTEYGVVIDQVQNSSYHNLNARRNKSAVVLANGVRNCQFYNPVWQCEDDTKVAASVDSRSLIFLLNTSNPHSFGLSGSVTAGGNDANSFFGGILETINGGIADYIVETKNPSAYGGTVADQNSFFSTEFDGPALFKFDSTWTAKLEFYSCRFGWSNGVDMTSGAYGTMNFYGYQYLSGGNGQILMGIKGNTNFKGQFDFSLTDFVIPPYYSTNSDGTVVYTAASRKFSYSGGGAAYSGFTVPNTAFHINGHLTQFVANVKPIIQFTFTAANIVGGSTQIKVYAAMPSSPFRRLIGTYSAGTQTVLYQCQGDEDGTLSFGMNDVTSFDVNGITIKYL